MPRYLTEKDIADFRAELCKVATERFARFGYEGVTMRQLAEALGCSPKTPYRYFKDKADILATVRAEAFARFSDALEQAAASAADPLERGRHVAEAYLKFALGNPHAYRAVGNILTKNYDRTVPCHRVIRSDGTVGGYNRGSRRKRERLEREGVSLLS